MVREICVHDDDEGARYVSETVHVCSAETELACSGLQHDVCGRVNGLELLGNF